jgi:hypothetical protein
VHQEAKPKRKHRATGQKPPGGARAGAGRPEGSRNTLPLGAVNALKGLKHRVPEGTAPELAELADDALALIATTLREPIYDPQVALAKLKLAQAARAEVCGPIAQKHEHTVAVSFAQLVEQSIAEGEE